MPAELLPSAWIHTGTGCLYGSPFVSRCLLYHLYDINFTLLIYHEPTVSSTMDTESDPGVMAFKAVARQPEAIYVHHAPSVKDTLKKLVDLSPTRLDINRTSTLQRSFGEILLEVEPIRLPVNDMFILGNDCGRSLEHQIVNTAYSVKSSVRMAGLGTGLKEAFRCWKVSVLSNDRKTSYDFYSPRDWDLTALSIEKDWKPTLEIRLAKKS